MNDTVRVQHRHYFEDKILPQLLGIFMVGKQKLKNAVTDIRGNRFSRMDTGSDEDIWLIDVMV